MNSPTTATQRIISLTVLMCVVLLISCSGRSDAPHGDSTAHRTGHHPAGPGGESHATKLEFTSAPSTLQPGKSAIWTLKIVDSASGTPVAAFDTSHTRLLHLIVVSRDLTWFNHLHPEYRGNGLFTVEATLPRAGSYVLHADYRPTGRTQDVVRHEITTAGAPTTTAETLLTPDTAGAGGWMVATVGAAPEGMPDRTEGNYQVALISSPLKARKDVTLRFQIRDSAGKPIAALQPYLGAKGHCVILSADTKRYLHTHPTKGQSHGGDDGEGMGMGLGVMSGPGGTAVGVGSTLGSGGESAKSSKADLFFRTRFPQPGRYKVWAQFRHNDRIITAPFVIEVAK